MKTRKFADLAKEILTKERIQKSKKKARTEFEALKTISEQPKSENKK